MMMRRTENIQKNRTRKPPQARVRLMVYEVAPLAPFLQLTCRTTEKQSGLARRTAESLPKGRPSPHGQLQ